MINYSELIYLYKQGSEFNAYTRFGAHPLSTDGQQGTLFSVYAPQAKSVCLAGDFNGWDTTHTMTYEQGIWSCFFPGTKQGQLYKYLVEDQTGKQVYKADPYGFASELRPKSASVICDPFSYTWTDTNWMDARRNKDSHLSPVNIYEMSLSSWDTIVKDRTPIDLRSLANRLVAYCKGMHYTHIELMPVTEYPLDTSWGYQVTGYFCLSGRYGDPSGLQYLIDLCHAEGIGVILDWVPGHFCPDEHGLANFDGTPLYGEYLHPHWGTYKFNFDKRAVWSFLLSSAVFWAKTYHIDGIRVDGVTSMLYLNYGEENQDKRNAYGGLDDLNAKAFLKKFNDVMHQEFPGFLTFAEESSAYQGVTAPTRLNGLGFDYKWNMGWMNDTLDYFSVDYDFRGENHNKITFASVYSRTKTLYSRFPTTKSSTGKNKCWIRCPENTGESSPVCAH